MSIYLDLHLSDTWADPSDQVSWFRSRDNNPVKEKPKLTISGVIDNPFLMAHHRFQHSEVATIQLHC